MLGITREYLEKESIAEILDFAEIYFQCSLWDVVYYYCNKKRIQEYDDKERVNDGHKIEIDSKYTFIAYKNYIKQGIAVLKTGQQLKNCKLLIMQRSMHLSTLSITCIL
jgi:hypothetical protein